MLFHSVELVLKVDVLQALLVLRVVLFDVFKELSSRRYVTIELFDVVLLGRAGFVKCPDRLRPTSYFTFLFLVLLLGELHLFFLFP